MQNLIARFVIRLCLGVTFLTPLAVISQTAAKPAGESFEVIQKRLCLTQKNSQARTFDIREYPAELGDKGAYGKKHWYDFLGTVFPFLKKPKDRYAINDVRTLLDLGRPAPLGESKRSFEIRSNARKSLEELQTKGEQKWEEWLKLNPNAPNEEKLKAEIRFRYQGLALAKLENFDWRKEGLDVGEVGFQGWQCNTCWAFATVDAAQISRRLAAIRSGKTDLSEGIRPNVRQLMSCLLPKGSNYCEFTDFSWHGEAFTFMVDRGLPLGGASKYGGEKLDWECDPETWVKALTWDFVSKLPQEVSPTQELKEAIIVNGPIVTTLNMDLCLPSYGGRVFNEEQNSNSPADQVYHMVLIIGWDDSKGAWLIKNSYGTQWGEKGFGWIKYGSNNVGKFSAFVVADPKAEEQLSRDLKK